MNLTFLRITVVFLLFTGTLIAQENEFIRGKLLDATTGEPLIFATVRIKGNSIGVITNEDGGFRLPQEFRDKGDTIQISSMGYHKKEIPLIILSSTVINTIQLSPNIFKLEDVVVESNQKRKPSATQIVQYAITNIPENYSEDDFSLVGYYRDYQENKGEYVNLNEAIIEIRDKGFKVRNNFNANFLMYSHVKNMDFKRDPFMAKPYDYNRGDKVIPSATMFNSGGNEFLTLIIHDAIRNYREKSFSFVGHMEKGFISNHKFSIIRNTFFNDQLVYEISIKYRNNGYLAKGKIHINKNTFAIHKLDYSLCIQKLMRPSNYAETPEVFDNERGHADAGLIYQIITEYLPGEDQKLFLNYISFRNKFILKRPPIFAVTKFVIDLDDKCFKVTLNRRPRDLDKVRKKDFKFLYKEKELPIEKFRFEEDSLRFWVYPDTLVASLQNEMEELFTETDSLRISNFYYNFKNIKDSLGNNLDERSSENLEQYREFFVQDVLTKIDSEPGDVIFMNRELPLFSPFQPVYSEKRNHKYWMNTPLQKTED